MEIKKHGLPLRSILSELLPRLYTQYPSIFHCITHLYSSLYWVNYNVSSDKVPETPKSRYYRIHLNNSTNSPFSLSNVIKHYHKFLPSPWMPAKTSQKMPQDNTDRKKKKTLIDSSSHMSFSKWWYAPWFKKSPYKVLKNIKQVI